MDVVPLYTFYFQLNALYVIIQHICDRTFCIFEKINLFYKALNCFLLTSKMTIHSHTRISIPSRIVLKLS